MVRQAELPEYAGPVSQSDEPPSRSFDLDAEVVSSTGGTRFRLFCSRLLVGLIVLISAEVFSGASLQSGLWHPWTLIVTYWLYFAHFFLFTTLAVWTGRTSLSSLYLWGVLFGLYESWITKVIWFGYGGDGQFALGSIGPYGFSELSMVFFFHPVMSLILPLAVTCVLCPPLRRWFPDLAWITGKSRGARFLQAYLVLSFGPIVAMNSGGIVNLALNLLFAGVLVVLLLRLSSPYLATSNGRSLVTLGRFGFCAVCGYLLLLYAVTYFHLRAEGLPTPLIQAATFVFYGLAILGLRLHGRQILNTAATVPVAPNEARTVITVTALVLALGMILSPLAGMHALFVPIAVSLLIWTPLGILLAAVALVKGCGARTKGT